MRYLKLYEKFIQDIDDIDVDQDIELSDKTIDDVMKDDFFDDVKDKDLKSDDSYIDSKGTIHIKNWKIY